MLHLVRNFWQSQVGKKAVMAVTGLIGVGFVIGHMIGNLQMFSGPEKINSYAQFLHGTMGNALWLVRLVLIGAVALHVTAAVQLTRQKQAARPAGYGYKKWEPQISTFASRSIRWGGAYLLVWLVFHILHFTARVVFPGYDDHDVYGNVIKGFSPSHWYVVVGYVVAMFFLALHLYHGAWSSMRTLGLSRPRPRPTSRSVATVVAAVVTLGFVAVPLAVLFGVVKFNPASERLGTPAAEQAREQARTAPRAAPTSVTATR